METLVVAQHHKNRSYRSYIPSGTRGFGMLPSSPSPTIPLPPREGILSSPIPRTPKRSPPHSDDFSGSELFAGPAYSNSPPPSALPIPKFSLRQKRSVSLDLPASSPMEGVAHHPVANSAPTSPKRGCSSPIGCFFISNAHATENLRRILHLDVGSDH